MCKQLSLNPNSREIIERGEFLLRSNGQFKENLQLADNLITNNQSVFAAYQNRSINKYLLKDYIGSLKDILTAGEIEPLAAGYRTDSVIANLNNLTNDQKFLDYYNLAINSYEKTLTNLIINPPQTTSNANTNMFYVQNAVKEFGTMLNILLLHLADYYEENGNFTKVEYILNKIIQIEPKRLSYGYRANYYRKKGKPDEAKEDETKAVEIEIAEITKENNFDNLSMESKAETLVERGNLYTSIDEFDKAIADYEKAKTFDKNIETKANEKITAVKIKIAENVKQPK